MSPSPPLAPPRRYKRSAKWIGALVLFALGVALGQLLYRAGRQWRAAGPAAAAAAPAEAPAAASIPAAPAAAPGAPVVRRLRGVVRQPDGQPAAGATVAVLRALTAWPEWRSERLDQAITGGDGAFEFALATGHALLLDCEHPAFARWLDEVPEQRSEVEIRLQPGFELSGVVTNDVGVPLANARVAVEAVLADQRRARATATGANGAFRFTNLAPGPVRVVARHEWWQPQAVSAVVGGGPVRADLRFERPALAPLRGRVVSTVGQQPIAGATVELVAPNARLGLADPLAATTAADGSFLIPGIARGNLRALVRHPEHGTSTRTLAVGAQAGELLFELPPRSRVRGQLAFEADAGAGGAAAAPPLPGTVLQIRDASGQLDHAVVGPGGRFAFAAPLSPGWAAVTALGAPFAFQRTLAREMPVRIEEAPATELELVAVPAGAVRGRVVDDRGAPLAGVAIAQTRVLAENARWLSDAAVQLDISSIGSQVAQLVTFDRDELLAVSDADGRFEFRGQKPGLLLVRCDLAGRGSRWLRVSAPSRGRATDLGDVALPRAAAIQGRVLRGLRPLAGAMVTAAGQEAQAVALSRADGSFVLADLPPGEYRLRARLPSQPNGLAERLVLARAEAPATVDLVLPVGRTLRGVVTGSDGQPVPGALVALRGAGGQPTVTDGAGAFALELPPRAAELQVALADRSRQVTVPVGPAQAEVAVQLPTPATCTLVGEVFGLPGRTPLAGARLRVQALQGDAAEARTTWVDLSAGELRWPLCPAGRVRLEIAGEGYAPFAIERDLAANEEHRLGTILLEPGCRVQGRVVDEHGAPIGNAVVCLGEEGDLDLFEPRVRSGGDGTFQLGGVTSRSRRLVARAPGYAATAVDLQLPQDVLTARPLEVVLEAGSTIEVLVSRSLRAESGLVQLRQGGRVLATAELDEAGRAVFANRGEGDYAVQLFGAERPPQPVRVAGSGRIVRVQLR